VDEEAYRYRAFISYRHTERDRKWAQWLIEKLETFRTPHALVRQGVPSRIGRLFRDDDEIPASSDLSGQIEEALRVSKFLIVVCSPETPSSLWVRREIDYFQSAGRGGRILALLVEGEPEQSFPPELLSVERTRIGADGGQIVERIACEPIAADVRPRSGERRFVTERRALLRVAAGLLGVGYDDLVHREHQRQVRRQQLWGTIAAALLIAASTGTYEYWDYSRTKTEFYAGIGARWGVPFGIGRLSADATSHRSVSYAVTTRRGMITEVKRVNGSGGLVALRGDGIDSESWLVGVAEWRMPYPSERAAEIDICGANGRVMIVQHFTWQPDGSAVVSFANAAGGAEALGRPGPEAESFELTGIETPTRRSLVAMHRLMFNEAGFVTRRYYRTIWGTPAKDAD